VFPAEVEVPGWQLQLTETRLKAWPGDRFYDEGAARADLEPLLHGWAASAEVVDQVRMETFFLDAEMRAIAAVSMYATARMQVGGLSDFGAAREDMSVEIILERVPKPLWSRDSVPTREARENCLRPMRALRRPVPDAAYALVMLLDEWAGGLQQAAIRLRVSQSLLKRAKTLSGQARQRKPGKGSRSLSDEEVDFLRRAIEALLLRLHRVESGLDPGEMMNADALK
jgi:hypothetical protein